MSSHGSRPRIQTVKGFRSKSFPLDCLSPFPKSLIFILRHGIQWERARFLFHFSDADRYLNDIRLKFLPSKGREYDDSGKEIDEQ
jgi:hypothetical protein